MSDKTGISWTDSTWVHSMHGANMRGCTEKCREKSGIICQSLSTKGGKWRKVVLPLQDMAPESRLWCRRKSSRRVGCVVPSEQKCLRAVKVSTQTPTVTGPVLRPRPDWRLPASPASNQLLCRSGADSESQLVAMRGLRACGVRGWCSA